MYKKNIVMRIYGQKSSMKNEIFNFKKVWVSTAIYSSQDRAAKFRHWVLKGDNHDFWFFEITELSISITFLFLIEINIPSRWGYNMTKILTRPIFGLSHLPDISVGPKFCFFLALGDLPPLCFPQKLWNSKKSFFFTSGM